MRKVARNREISRVHHPATSGAKALQQPSFSVRSSIVLVSGIE
jgi:hypothetical protein